MNCKQNVISIVCMAGSAANGRGGKNKNKEKSLFFNLKCLKPFFYLSYLILSYLILSLFYYYTTILLLKWKHNVISIARNNSNVISFAGGF